MVFSVFKRAWGFLGGMECGQYMCKVSKVILQFCSYLHTLPQSVILKEGQYTISVLASSFPRKLMSLVSKLLPKACCCCALLVVVVLSTYCYVLQCSNLQRYFPSFPSCCAKNLRIWAHPQHWSEPVCWTPYWSDHRTFPEAPGSSLSIVKVSRGFLVCPFAPVLSTCSGSICQLPEQHICYTGGALQPGLQRMKVASKWSVDRSWLLSGCLHFGGQQQHTRHHLLPPVQKGSF